jgi:hypothetical protein
MPLGDHEVSEFFGLKAKWTLRQFVAKVLEVAFGLFWLGAFIGGVAGGYVLFDRNVLKLAVILGYGLLWLAVVYFLYAAAKFLIAKAEQAGKHANEEN